MITGSLQGRIYLQRVPCKPYRVWVCSEGMYGKHVGDMKISNLTENCTFNRNLNFQPKTEHFTKTCTFNQKLNI
jgi:hypothetical protein